MKDDLLKIVRHEIWRRRMLGVRTSQLAKQARMAPCEISFILYDRYGASSGSRLVKKIARSLGVGKNLD